MKNKRHAKQDDAKGRISRRSFLKLSGTAAVGMWVGKALPDLIWIDEAVAAISASEGYLLVDTKKCQGCMSCMLACSVVHEGAANLSLARIQVIQNPFERWPLDLTIEQCRQCIDPRCVAACPAHALEPNPKFGHVRMVDKERCTGCGECAAACPYPPSRSLVATDEKYQNREKARKCDLCAQAPYHWYKRGGGPQGRQACVEVCPVKAIKFTKEIPIQAGEAGYKVNLRDEKWAGLGYPMD